VFAYCYGRIFHTIRRHSKVLADNAVRGQDVPTATTSRDPNTGQVQQQATAATTGAKLSRTEMNVLKTMIAVVICHIICWSVPAIANSFAIFGVSINVNWQAFFIINILKHLVLFDALLRLLQLGLGFYSFNLRTSVSTVMSY